MIPFISPKMQRFGTAGQLPTITGPRLFSPLSSNSNLRRDVSSSFNKSKSNIKFGSETNKQNTFRRWKIMNEVNLLTNQTKSVNLLQRASIKNDILLSRNNVLINERSHKEIRLNCQESVGSFSKWRGVNSKFTTHLLKAASSPLIRKARKIDSRSMENQNKFLQKQNRLNNK